MNKEEKELLLMDLCARLPYETRVRYIYAFAGAVGISGYSDEGILSYDKLQNFSLPNVGYEKRRVDNILPYLRPMSSLTKEERIEIGKVIQKDRINPSGEIKAEGSDNLLLCTVRQSANLMEWLNAHHFDYRGLIDMGLALEALEGMYDTKTK